jgi:hypothetical protein
VCSLAIVAEPVDVDRLKTDGFERVYVELEWYDGLREGVADVDGAPHYLRYAHEYDPITETVFKVWPVPAEAFAWEREQWAIYVAWNDRQRAGEVDVLAHPGLGGIDARYDELQSLLEPFRQCPEDAGILRAEFSFDAGERYRADGLDCWVRWESAAAG